MQKSKIPRLVREMLLRFGLTETELGEAEHGSLLRVVRSCLPPDEKLKETSEEFRMRLSLVFFVFSRIENLGEDIEHRLIQALEVEAIELTLD
jgi:hypothetical protein